VATFTNSATNNEIKAADTVDLFEEN
jgi:hypothetical protein